MWRVLFQIPKAPLLNAAARRREEYGMPVTIGSDVWVGGGAIMLPGVSIGDGAVIRAGSVATRPIPGGVFAAGNPCRVIRDITACGSVSGAPAA
jgi:maltose O-acetyltransferase